MKKYLLLAMIIMATSHAFAFVSQGHWRWRKDDGSEITATYLADTNTTPTITSYGNIRLRTELYNNNDTIKSLSNTTLAYSLTGADNTWVTITNDSINNDFVLAKSLFVADSTPTTQQLPARPGYPFQPGRVISSVAAFNYSIPDTVSTEFEFVIKPTAKVKLDTIYFFETSTLGYDKPLPSLKIAAVLPVTITSFTVAPQDNKALVKWTTATETNNDHFDIMRSANGQSWQTIATMKAKGNGGTAQNTYEITDNTPLSGDSYYRLRQSDKDGKSTLSEVKPFTLANLKDLAASVFPNPTSAAINVVVKNYSGSLTATVTNTSGTVVHKEVLAVSNTTSSYKLSLNQKLSSGIYYITLSGTDFSQKMKVIVQ